MEMRTPTTLTGEGLKKCFYLYTSNSEECVFQGVFCLLGVALIYDFLGSDF